MWIWFLQVMGILWLGYEALIKLNCAPAEEKQPAKKAPSFARKRVKLPAGKANPAEQFIA